MAPEYEKATGIWCTWWKIYWLEFAAKQPQADTLFGNANRMM